MAGSEMIIIHGRGWATDSGGTFRESVPAGSHTRDSVTLIDSAALDDFMTLTGFVAVTDSDAAPSRRTISDQRHFEEADLLDADLAACRGQVVLVEQSTADFEGVQAEGSAAGEADFTVAAVEGSMVVVVDSAGVEAVGTAAAIGKCCAWSVRGFCPASVTNVWLRAHFPILH
jgi:hypothetical protein